MNEEIAKAYFEEVCGYMVRTGFYFKKVRKQRSGKEKGGAGPADIDLLIMHPNPDSAKYKAFTDRYGAKAMVSVKGWHQEPETHRIAGNALATIDRACSSLFGDPQASKYAKEYFGNDGFRKLLVISRLDTRFKKEQEEHALKRYGASVIEFREVICELLERIEHRTYFPESEILQTIKLMSKYVLNR